MKKEINKYIHDFEDIYNGEPFYGKPLVAIISKVDPQTVFQKPAAASHSVYEITRHLYAWRELLLKRLNGDKNVTIEMNSMDDWAPLPDSDAASHWKELLKQLEQNQKELIRALNKITDEALDNPFAGSAYTLRIFLNGQIQHDIYHIGQIALAGKNNQTKNYDSKNLARAN